MTRLAYVPNRIIDHNGIADGATVHVYLTGTTTPVNLYSDLLMTVAMANPFTVAAGASFPAVYYDSSVNIKLTIISASDGSIEEYDPYNPLSVSVSSPFTSVAAFGVLGDGSDETIKIQNALNSITGRLVFPTGSYGMTAVTVPSNVHIEGSGANTWFVPLDNTSTMMTLAGGNRLFNFQVVPSTQRTGGIIFKPTGNQVTIEKFVVNNAFKVLDLTSAVSLFVMDDFKFLNCNNAGASELVNIDTTGTALSITNAVVDANPGLQPSAGIKIKAVSDIILDNLNLIDCGVPLSIVPTTGKTVASIKAGKLFLDSSTTGGLVLDTSGGGSIVRCTFADIEASSHGGSGVTLNASAGLISGIEIGHLETHLNAADGVHMSGVNFGNVTILHHSAGGNASGAAISIGASCPGPTISEAQYGILDGIVTANKYGIFLGSSGTIKVRSGKITGNTTADITGDTSGATVLNVTGLLTRNRGSATLASGGTSIVISHGLAGTPSANNIKFWATSNQGTTPLWLDTSTITSTQFTVKTTSATAANITFGWEATCLGA